MTSQKRLIGPVLVAGALAAACWAAAQRLPSRASIAAHGALLRSAPPPPSSTAWPSPEARLVVPDVVFPADFGVRRVYVDAGHGSTGNPGNTSCYCVDEQDFTLFAARELALRLGATGHFDARVSRGDGELVSYADRVADAARFGAQAFVSLHSDVRTRADRWSPAPGQSCPVSHDAPGFTVIYSDTGDAAPRRRLAAAEARRLAETGLLPHDGSQYGSLYEADKAAPGLFIDRHAADQRIFVLSRAPMPSILVETHHALDPREALRWMDAATLDAFAAATAAALVDALAETTSDAGDGFAYAPGRTSR